TSKDLRTEHPYNTYTTYGLPPGPIASAGAAALQAAVAPMDCKDLYFVSRNNGTHVFCPDLRCHESAVEYWQREFFRQRNRGGRLLSIHGSVEVEGSVEPRHVLEPAIAEPRATALERKVQILGQLAAVDPDQVRGLSGQ